MLFIGTRSAIRQAGQRELLKHTIIDLIETNAVGISFETARIHCARERVPYSLAYKLVDALGRNIITSLVIEKLSHLGLHLENDRVARHLSDDLRIMLDKLCPYSVWGSSPASNANRTANRRTDFLTALITEMVDDRQLFIDPDDTPGGLLASNEPPEWHLIVTSGQLLARGKAATA